jgi:hypothetical protein
MTRYKVKKPFIDYGMYHEINEVITDASIITNKEVKLWEGVLAKIREDGTEIPFEKLADTPKEPKSETPKPKVTVAPKVKVAESVPAAKSTTPVVKVVKTTTK